MQIHPYIGLRAVYCEGKPTHERRGTIVAIGQGGSTSEDSCAFIAAILLLDDGAHYECDLAYLNVDAAEAKARLAKAGA
jgi:hypothetical protein